MTKKAKIGPSGARAESQVIPFTRTENQLVEFEGMNIKIDVDKQRENWRGIFTDLQLVLRFCNFDHVESEKKARVFLLEGIFDELLAR